MATYLNPKNDVAFKKLFGDMAHKDIVISFLNSILERKEGAKIIDVVMNDTNNVPENKKLKLSIVDIRCTDQAGNQYIIEMQVATQKYYAVRAQYYSTLAFSRQLGEKERYDTLLPVIFVGVLDFNLFDDDDYLCHNLIIDTKTQVQKFNCLEFHILELKKFKKKLEELTTLAEKWIYFLSNAHEQHQVPDNLVELKEAFLVLNKTNWEIKELNEYELTLDRMRSEAGKIDFATEKGEARGIEIGKAEGRLEEKINLAQQFLDVLDIETVAKKTGLDIETVKKLKPEQ